MLSKQQIDSFEEKGYLILRDVLSAAETKDAQRWAQEVHDWPTDRDSPWMPYEEINADGRKVLCRTENYANSHAGFNGLLRGERLRSLLAQLAGEDVLLFKEKINYKLAGSGGFAPHIDAVAYTHIKAIQHLSVLLAIDPSDMSNGGLEVVDGSHAMQVPIGSDNCIEPDWVREQRWTPVELAPGQLLIFGSYLAHRSGSNHSKLDRKALYATYNGASEGDLHDEYYAHRRVVWPPLQSREGGKAYGEGALRYGFGSPMLSVVAGKQLEFDEKPKTTICSPTGGLREPNSTLKQSGQLDECGAAVPPTPNVAPTAQRVMDMLSRYGQSDYIGEPISQIEHSLQCAHLAVQASADGPTIAAALLHDIGQFIPEAEAEHLMGGASIQDMRRQDQHAPDARTSDCVGRVSHETLGARYLLALGFPQKVADLVEGHVAAKRYLCAIEPGYYDGLSDASKESLRFQGGPMNPDEVRQWQAAEWADEKANLRRWDDGAKVVGLEVHGLETYRSVLEQVLGFS